MRIWLPIIALIFGVHASAAGVEVAVAHSKALDEPRGWVIEFAQQSDDDLDCEDFETQEEAQAMPSPLGSRLYGSERSSS